MQPYLLRYQNFFDIFTSTVANDVIYPRHDNNAASVPVVNADAGGVEVAITANPATASNNCQLVLRRLAPNYFGKRQPVMVKPQEDPSSAPSALMALPTEILLQIISLLGGPYFYIFRLTCSRMLKLYEAAFRKSWEEWLGCEGPYSVALFLIDQRTAIANCLHHADYCTSCIAAEEDGTVENQLKALRSLRHCNGCRRSHASALFFPDVLEVPEDDSNRSTCIGRLGHINLCGHTYNPVRWQDIDTLVGQDQKVTHSAVCTNRTHGLRIEERDKLDLVGSSFPRFMAKLSLEHASVLQIGYGWDLPVLQIESSPYSSLAATQAKLSNLVPEAFRDRNLCRHISADYDLLKFVQTGICSCYTAQAWITREDQNHSCSHGQQNTLECRVCGAVYSWLCLRGLIVLSFRYIWRISQPTSPGWLNALDRKSLARLYTQKNKHVLWCDVRRCRTNTRPQWEALVKEDLDRAEYQQLEGDLTDTWDCEEIRRASDEGCLQNW